MADALEVRELTVERRGQQILRDVDFHAKNGRVAAILGPNGAGKTTLLKAIAGLLPYRGQITIEGKVAETLPARERAQTMAFVPQHTLLHSALPVHQVVLQGRYPHLGHFRRPTTEDVELVQQAMDTVDVARFSQRPFTGLSFGEQRRVLLARGLSTGARILCLDEPTASLDIAHALSLYQLLRKLAARGHCVVLVMHQLDEALTHTDDALLLSEGRRRAHGATAEVITAANVREVYDVEMRSRAGLRFKLSGDPK